MLELRHISAGYGKTRILQDISLVIPDKALTILVGPNGSGKSTLLKTIAGIIHTDAGEVDLDGNRLTGLPSRRTAQRIAYLPQNRTVPDITVSQLVLHGRFPYLDYPRRYRKSDLEMAKTSMEQMGLSDFADAPLYTLSGGMRQKAYIAMALTQDTPVILLDEPTTFLDIAHQLHTMELMKTLSRSGKTVIAVLHDLPTALAYADRLVVMEHGAITAQGDPNAICASGVLSEVFGVHLVPYNTPDGQQYYIKPRERSL